MKTLLFIFLLSIGCSTTSKTTSTQQNKKLENLKAEYSSITEEVQQNKKNLSKEEISAKIKKGAELETEINNLEKEIEKNNPKNALLNTSYNYDVKYPSFRIKNIEQIKNKLNIDVSYAGCGSKHDFDIIHTGKIDSEGIADLYLIDNTKGDNCKMLLLRTIYFDVSFYEGKAAVKGFRINNSPLSKYISNK